MANILSQRTTATLFRSCRTCFGGGQPSAAHSVQRWNKWNWRSLHAACFSMQMHDHLCRSRKQYRLVTFPQMQHYHQQSESDSILRYMKDAQMCFQSLQYSETEAIHSELFSLLYSAGDLQSLWNKQDARTKEGNPQHSSPLETYFSTVIQHLQHMQREGYVFVTLPLFKAHWAIAGLCQQMGLFERAKQEIDKAIALASPAANAPPPVANVPPVFHVSPTAAIENSMEQRDMLSLMKITEASILIKLGRKDEAVALHKTAIKEIGVHLTEQNAMQVATAYAELAEIYVEKNSIQIAIGNLSRSFAISESFFGWIHPQIVQTAFRLSKLYLENDNIDAGIIVGEKALIGLEIHHRGSDPCQITTLGCYLAKGYEKKKSFEMEQITISRVINLLKRKENVLDPQLYQESVFKLQNMMGACRFLSQEFRHASVIYKRLDRNVEKILPGWLKRQPMEARFELGHMKYFRGATLVKLQRFDDGIQSIKEAVNEFEKCGHGEWVAQCKRNIEEARNLRAKATEKKE